MKKDPSDYTQRELYLYLFVRLGFSNAKMFNEVMRHNEAVMNGTGPTEIELELRADPSVVRKYLKEHNVDPHAYITALDRDFPMWAVKSHLYVINRGEKKPKGLAVIAKGNEA